MIEPLNIAKEVGKRLYAMGFILLIGWVSWRAFLYLVDSLVLMPPPPPQIVGIPRRLDMEVLTSKREAFAGLEATDLPRMPPSHYHRVEGWFQPDRRNDCTTSGCHAPLPHSRNKSVRAFLNMHATSLHCGVCHMDVGDGVLATVWYDLDSGRKLGTPALLQLYSALLKYDSPEKPDKITREDLVALADEAAQDSDGEPTLLELANHLRAYRPESAAHRKVVEQAKEKIPRYFRGEYGAKLAIANPKNGEPILGYPNTEQAKADLLAARSNSTGELDALLVQSVHPLARSVPRSCDDCHNVAHSILDFESLGYPKERVAALNRPLVVRAVEHISEGTPFFIPGFTNPNSSGKMYEGDPEHGSPRGNPGHE